MIGHPSTRRLQRWLEGGESGLDTHVGTCAKCAERLEGMAPDQTTLRQPLIELLRPPDQLPERLKGTIQERLRSYDDLTLFSEMFGLPIRTVRVMTTTASSGDV